MPITGYLSTSSWGWPASFYVFGVLGVVWCGFWWVLSADRPSTHRGISMEERRYIETSLGQENDDDYMVSLIEVCWLYLGETFV